MLSEKSQHPFLQVLARSFTLPNFLFLAILYISAMEPLVKTRPPHVYLAVMLMIELYFIIGYIILKQRRCHDISSILLAFFVIWGYTTKTGTAHKILMPPMENVFYVFYSHWQEILTGLASSMYLIVWGFSFALVSAVILGIVIGWIARLRQAILPIVRIISPIPALAYTTYVVAAMPNFRTASIVVIFLGVFWPTFSLVINTVGNMDKKIIDSARILNINTPTMLKYIVFPYVLPSVLRNLSSTLATAFMCLTGAELIGASTGVGFFIRKYSDYANYTNVLAGIIFMGVAVTSLNVIVRAVQKKFITW